MKAGDSDPGPDSSPEVEWLPPRPFIAPPKALKARVATRVALHVGPPRGAIARQTVMLTAASWMISAVVFGYAGGLRPTGRPISLILGTSAGIGAIAAVAGWAALGRGASTLGRARQLLIPIVVGSPVFIVAWKIFWSAQYEGAIDHWPTRPGFRCLALSVSLAICPLLAFAISRRGTDPRRPVFTGFAAGLAIGSITSLLTDLWCPVAYVPHLLLGHLLPIVLLGGLGAWLGSIAIALRG
jgi:hypothetical protein